MNINDQPEWIHYVFAILLVVQHLQWSAEQLVCEEDQSELSSPDSVE